MDFLLLAVIGTVVVVLSGVGVLLLNARRLSRDMRRHRSG